jgi:MFS family permease
MSDQPPSKAAAFLSRDFRRYQVARVMAIIGSEAQALAVAWQVYQITHKAIDLGYTGLALFLPGLLFILPSGHTADRFDRRVVILVCYGLQVFCTFTLFLFAWHGLRSVWPIYGVLFLIGTGRAFSGPASSALIPHLVPKDHFVNAVTWGATIFQIANITGPALGGILFTLPLRHTFAHRLYGAPLVYLFTLFSLFWFLLLVGSLSVRPGRMEHRAASLEVVLAGFHYVARTPILLGSISLDLFAVLLGGATSLMPIFAEEILHAGPRGLGLLRSAPAIGALMVSFLLTWFPIRRRAGVLMLTCVAIFGAFTVLFGLSTSLPLSLFALFVAGASDMVSVVVRSSVLQLGTPPEMRGRVSAVNSLFLGFSNEFGEFESGLTAQWLGAVRAVVLGGLASMAVTGLWSIFFPALRKASELTPEALMSVQHQPARQEVPQP